MPQWIPVGDGFIEADVIRWKEAIYERKGRRRVRSVRIGDRLVTAEVLGEADEKGWVSLLVLSCEIVKLKDGKKPEMWGLKNNTATKRKLSTLRRTGVDRMLWPDGESARAVIASRFIGNEKRQKPLQKSDPEKR